MFYLKVHEMQGDVLVAVCDREILGKRYFDGEVQFEVKEKFYGSQIASESDVIAALNKATIANLAGNRIVDLAIKNKMVENEHVLVIGGVKHAQFMFIQE